MESNPQREVVETIDALVPLAAVQERRLTSARMVICFTNTAGIELYWNGKRWVRQVSWFIGYGSKEELKAAVEKMHKYDDNKIVMRGDFSLKIVDKPSRGW